MSGKSDKPPLNVVDTVTSSSDLSDVTVRTRLRPPAEGETEEEPEVTIADPFQQLLDDAAALEEASPAATLMDQDSPLVEMSEVRDPIEAAATTAATMDFSDPLLAGEVPYDGVDDGGAGSTLMDHTNPLVELDGDLLESEAAADTLMNRGNPLMDDEGGFGTRDGEQTARSALAAHRVGEDTAVGIDEPLDCGATDATAITRNPSSDWPGQDEAPEPAGVVIAADDSYDPTDPVIHSASTVVTYVPGSRAQQPADDTINERPAEAPPDDDTSPGVDLLPPEREVVAFLDPAALSVQAHGPDVTRDPPGATPVAVGTDTELEIDDDQVLEIVTERREEQTKVEPRRDVAAPQERWEDRAAALQERLAVTEERAARVELMMELGQLQLERSEDRELAAATLEAVLELEPAHEAAFAALDQIYQLEWDTEKQIDLIINRTEHVPGDEQGELLRRVAELYEKEGERDKAIIAMEAAQKACPGAASIAYELERLTGKPVDAPALDPMELLEYKLQQATDDDARLEIYKQIAAAHGKRREVDREIESLEMILTLAPDHQATHVRLAQIYQQSKRPDLLASTLRRHLGVARREDRADLGLRLARLLEGPQGDPAGAVEAYREVLSHDPDQPLAIQALACLHQQIGDWASAARTLHKQVQQTRDGPARVDLLVKLGRLHVEHLADLHQAEGHLLEALQLNPGQGQAVELLWRIYSQRNDWGKAVKLVVQAEQHSASPLEKARYLYQAGLATLDGLDNEDRAMELFEEVLAIDPDHADAARPLATLYQRQGRNEDLVTVLELILRKSDGSDPAQVLDLYNKLGAASAALDRPDRARKYWGKAVELNATHLPSLRGLADLSFRTADWAAAGKRFHVMNENRSLLDAPALTHTLVHLGLCAQKLGRRDAALAYLQEALAMEPGHKEALVALAQLQSGARDWHTVVAAKVALLEGAAEEDRVDLCKEIGEIYWRKLNMPDEAISAFDRALEQKPDSHAILHLQIELYSETERWQAVIETCEKMAAIEEKPSLRAKYYFTAAVICRDKLDAADQALKFFNRVLDEDGDQLEAFQAIDALCTKLHDWKKLEHNYGKMIKRLPDSGKQELKVMLWHNLGEILRTRRRDFESAIAAFEAAARLDPDNQERRRILAELYMNSGEQFARQAADSQHALLRENPRLIDPYHALQKLYMDLGKYDRAWCLCEVLAFLGKATDEEQGFFNQYRRGGTQQPRGRATDELWVRQLHHPTQHPAVSSIFAVVAPAAAAVTVRPVSSYGLKPRERRDPEGKSTLFTRIFDHVTRTLGVTATELYLRPDSPEGLLMAHTPGVPTFVAGGQILACRSDRELTFTVAKQLAFLRPEHFLRNALPSRTQLQAVLLTAVQLFQPDLPLNKEQQRLASKVTEQVRKHLGPAQLEQLRQLVLRLPADQIDKIDRWWIGTTLTTDRAGLVLCGDLATAASMINAEPGPGDVSPGERVAQLVQFASSPSYFDARARMGLTIEQ